MRTEIPKAAKISSNPKFSFGTMALYGFAGPILGAFIFIPMIALFDHRPFGLPGPIPALSLSEQALKAIGFFFFSARS